LNKCIINCAYYYTENWLQDRTNNYIQDKTPEFRQETVYRLFSSHAVKDFPPDNTQGSGHVGKTRLYTQLYTELYTEQDTMHNMSFKQLYRVFTENSTYKCT
jgi:hypothetical protein